MDWKGRINGEIMLLIRGIGFTKKTITSIFNTPFYSVHCDKLRLDFYSLIYSSHRIHMKQGTYWISPKILQKTLNNLN